MNCKAYRDETDAADLGAAPSADAGRHLSLCDACRVFRDEREGLRRLLGGLGSVAAPADFEFRLRAAMRAGGGGPSAGLRARLFNPLSAAALATCAALALTVTYLRAPSTAPQTDPAAVASSSEVAASDAAPTETQTQKQTQKQTQTQNPDALASESTPEARRGGESSDLAVATEVVSKRAAQTKTGARRQAASQAQGAPGAGEAARATADSALRAAPVRTRLGTTEAAASNLPAPVQLSASRKPMRVVLRDERGASRVVSMRPVSFGSQEFVGRLGNSFRATDPTKEGVW